MNSRRDRELSESVVLLEARNKVNTSPYTWSSCSAAASEQCTLNFGGKWGGQKSDRRGNKDGALIKAQRFPKKNVRSVKVGESSVVEKDIQNNRLMFCTWLNGKFGNGLWTFWTSRLESQVSFLSLMADFFCELCQNVGQNECTVPLPGGVAAIDHMLIVDFRSSV